MILTKKKTTPLLRDGAAHRCTPHGLPGRLARTGGYVLARTYREAAPS